MFDLDIIINKMYKHRGHTKYHALQLIIHLTSYTCLLFYYQIQKVRFKIRSKQDSLFIFVMVIDTIFGRCDQKKILNLFDNGWLFEIILIIRGFHYLIRKFPVIDVFD